MNKQEKEKLDQIIEEEKQLYNLVSGNPFKENRVKEEDIPGVPMENELGEWETHYMIDGKYVPDKSAQVIFQERKIGKEYLRLVYLKKVEKQWNDKKAATLKELEKARLLNKKEKALNS